MNWFNEEPRLPGQGLCDPYLPSLYLSIILDFFAHSSRIGQGYPRGDWFSFFGFGGVLSEDLHDRQLTSLFLKLEGFVGWPHHQTLNIQSLMNWTLGSTIAPYKSSSSLEVLSTVVRTADARERYRVIKGEIT